jgi:hypothetical protein
MNSLRIHHRTTYCYREAVAFGPHRLMLRPRESRDLQLTGFELVVTPTPQVTWAHDVWGTAVASATFQSMHDTMVVDSVAQIELDAADWPIFDITASAIVYLFQYFPDDWMGLGALPVAIPGSGGAPRRMGARHRAWADDRHAVPAQGPFRGCSGCDPLSRTARRRGRRHRSRRSRAAGGRAGTSRCFSLKRRAAWGSGRASSRAT